MEFLQTNRTGRAKLIALLCMIGVASLVAMTGLALSGADIDVDSNRDGVVDNSADDPDEATWTTTRGAVFYYNIDDDDNNGVEDANDTVVNGEADQSDLARVTIRRHRFLQVGSSVKVSVAPPAQGRIRVFHDKKDSWSSVYSSGPAFALPPSDVEAGDVTLGIEARERISPSWNGQVMLTLEIRNRTGGLLASDRVLLRCAPWIMSTNLWVPQEIHVVRAGGLSPNAPFRTMIQSVAAAAGVRYVEIPGSSYSDDRWIQDSSEDGSIYLPQRGAPRRRIPSVLQLARYRAVDQWSVDVLFNPDFDLTRRFSSDSSKTNYGGNLEIIPPHAGYPWGRIVTGGGTSTPIGGGTPVTRRMTHPYRDYFNALALQSPHLEVSTEWLSVGHVDEHTMAVPAPSLGRGWALVIGSPSLARTILESVRAAGGGSLPVFQGRTGYQTTVNAILANVPLMAFNAEVQTRMDGVRNYYRAQIGLSDAEIIDLPVLYENAGSGFAVAYNPGVVNMVVIPTTSGTSHLLVPDPEGPDSPTDAWQRETTARLTALGTAGRPNVVHYVDVFFSYHTLMGEAHCGTNWVRIPPAQDWWDD